MSARERVAVVTGGSSGIGRAIALTLARHGTRVAVVGRKRTNVDETVRALDSVCSETRGDHFGLLLDVASEGDMEELASQVVRRLNAIDILVTSAGIGRRAGTTRVLPHPTHRLPLAEWSEVIDVNLKGVFLSNRAVLATMMRQRSGHILNICSSTTPSGLRGTPYAPAYCASKFAVVGLTEALAEEVAPYGIRVQALFPGPVTTPLVSQTRLDKPFGGSVSAETFAESVLWMFESSLDTVVVHPHVLPFAQGVVTG